MRILVVHQNFPGQFGHLVRAWASRPGWDVRGLGQTHAPGLPGFDKLIRYQPARAIRPDQHPYLRNMEAAVLNGQAAVRVMLELRNRGFAPDVIVAHPGWGETMYARDVFPKARLIHLCEWYYGADGADIGFDPEFPSTFDDRARIRTWNAQHALSVLDCDMAVSPTLWQKSRFPELLQSKIVVQHEGIDTLDLQPNPGAVLRTPSGVLLKAGDPVVTYVARNLEPYRGFHVFMRALEKVQQAHPSCHALIVGGDEVSYGKKPVGARNWREHMLREVTLDRSRTHFLGRIPRQQYLRVLQVSAAHVYLTYPFVLSWSLLESVACGVEIAASSTAPVKEALHMLPNVHWANILDPTSVSIAIQNLLLIERDPCAISARRAAVCARYSYEAGIAGYDQLLAPSSCSRSERIPSPQIIQRIN